MDWENGGARWPPQEPAQQPAESKPSYHKPFAPDTIEEHTPEQVASNLQILRDCCFKLAKKRAWLTSALSPPTCRTR